MRNVNALKRYRNLNLKEIREKTGIDFAHFTFQPGMCSCCYGPEDLPSLYWKDRKIKHDNYSYILFKNADNGSGAVTKNDWIEDYTCIMWGGMSMEKLKEILDLLQEQLGEAYYIEFPESEHFTAIIRTYL